MVAFHALRMIDAGKIFLDVEYIYANEGAQPEPKQICDGIDAMSAVSANHATQAVLKM